MPKQYVKFRIGFLDHLPMFASYPDALVVYNWCLLQAPISGPDSGCVRVNQHHLAELWGWSRPRLTRALKWLQLNPERSHPLLVRVEKGARNRPGKYVIPRFETTENIRRFGNGAVPNPPGFSSDYVTHRNRIARFSSDYVTHRNRNINKERARQKEREEEEQEEVASDVYDKAEWLTVHTEAEARQALLNFRGYAQLPESMRERAIETAMKNLEFYKIRYAPNDDEQEATG